MSFSNIEGGVRVCKKYEGDLSYSAYITLLLTEAGYELVYVSSIDGMLEFIHSEDDEMKIIITPDKKCWLHNIFYRGQLWASLYCGNTRYEDAGNRIFELVRISYARKIIT